MSDSEVLPGYIETNLLGTCGLLRCLLTFTLADGALAAVADSHDAGVLPYPLDQRTVGAESSTLVYSIPSRSLIQAAAEPSSYLVVRLTKVLDYVCP